MRKILSVLLSVVIILSVTACTSDNPILKLNDPEVKNWELVEKSGKKSVVTLCTDLKDEAALMWLKTEFTDYLKLTYDINLNIIEQTQTKTFEALASDVINEVTIGKYDLILFQNEGFGDAMDKGYLYGPFTDKLPNYKTYLNPNDIEQRYDEGRAIDHFIVPFGRNQLSFIYNEDYFYEIPETYEGLFGLFKTFPGKFTYPDPRMSKEGEAFILSYLGKDLDYEKLNETKYSKAELYEMIKPGLAQLNAIKPDLYSGGKNYPESVAKMDELLFNDELIFSMSLDYYHATDKLKAYEYPENANVFAMLEGTTGYVNHMGIVYDSGNKSGAMLVINGLLSPEMQASKYDYKKWRQLPIYDPNYLDSTAYIEIKKIKLKASALKQDEILSNRIPEFSLYYRQLIVSLWEEHVLN